MIRPQTPSASSSPHTTRRTCSPPAWPACAGRPRRCRAHRCTWSSLPTHAATGPPRRPGEAAPRSSRSRPQRRRGPRCGSTRGTAPDRAPGPGHVWLATTDADTLVPARWLRQQARYAGQGWDAIVGTIQVADWSGHPPRTRSLFRQRYEPASPAIPRGPPARSGQHPHVHGANLGFRASAYLRAGGFPDLPTAEDHALVGGADRRGSRVLRTRALPVVTSARRDPAPRTASATTSPRWKRPPPERGRLYGGYEASVWAACPTWSGTQPVR